MKKQLNEFGLTELQTKFLSNLVKDEEFTSFGLKAEVWTDYYCTTLDNCGIMNKMQSGACITTLNQKMYIHVGKTKRGKETAKYIRLKEKGAEVVAKLIDLSKFEFTEKPQQTETSVVEAPKTTKPQLRVIESAKAEKQIQEIIDEEIKVNDLVKCSEFDGRIKFRVQKIYKDGRVNIANMKKGSFTVNINTLKLTTSTINL